MYLKLYAMSVSGVRAGCAVRHFLRYQSVCAVTVQRTSLQRYQQYELSFIKTGGINFLSTSSPLQKEKSRNKEKSKAKVQKVDDKELSQYVDVEKLRSQFQLEVDKLKQLYVQQLSIRSSVGLIETMKIDFEGKSYELQDLAQIAKKGKNILAVNMAGFPQAAVPVMKALKSSSLGLNPTQDGTLITVPLPRATTEHRENLAKQAKAAFVECKKVMDRVVDQRNKEVKKEGSISKDELIRINSLLRLVEAEYLQTAESALKTKQEELKLED